MEVKAESAQIKEDIEASLEEALEDAEIDQQDQELFESLTNGEGLEDQGLSEDNSQSDGSERLMDYWEAQKEYRDSGQQEGKGRNVQSIEARQSDPTTSAESIDIWNESFNKELSDRADSGKPADVSFIFKSEEEQWQEASEEHHEALAEANESSEGDNEPNTELELDHGPNADLAELASQQEGEGESETELEQDQSSSGESEQGSAGFGGDSGQGRSQNFWTILDAARESSLQPIERSNRSSSNRTAAQISQQSQQALVQLEAGLEQRLERMNIEKAAEARENLLVQIQKEQLRKEQLKKQEEAEENQIEAQLKIEQMMAEIQARANGEPMPEDMRQLADRFLALIDGMWVIAESTSMGGFFVLFAVGGFMPFQFMPVTDKRGMIVDKAWEKLKGKGDYTKDKGNNAKGIGGGFENKLNHGAPGTMELDKDEKPLLVEEFSKTVIKRKEDFRDKFAKWLRFSQEKDAQSNKETFLTQVLQSYDAVPLNSDLDRGAFAAVWLSAFDVMTPEVLLAHCEHKVGEPLPELKSLLTRYHNGATILTQQTSGEVFFDEASEAVLASITDRVIINTPNYQSTGALMKDKIANLATVLQVPMIMIGAQDESYEIHATGLIDDGRSLLPLEYWDIDWGKQRSLVYMNAGQVSLLTRPF